jgi:hypothetical protein
LITAVYGVLDAVVAAVRDETVETIFAAQHWGAPPSGVATTQAIDAAHDAMAARLDVLRGK